MTVHEAMHGFTAYFLGDDTAKQEGRLTLNPIKHIDPFLTIFLPLILAVIGGPIFGGAKPVPFNPHRLRYDEWGAAFVAVSGPLTNLLIAFVAFGAFALIQPGEDTVIFTILFAFTTVNLGFFIFNMLPIPPLDGSRVMYALAPDTIRRGMMWLEQYGLIVVFILIVLAGQALGGFLATAINFFLSIFAHFFGLR